MTVAADGSAPPVEIAVIDSVTPLLVYFGMAYAADGAALFYTVVHPDTDDPDNGV